MATPIVGQIVYYTLPSGPNTGKARVAFVVHGVSNNVANLAVFIDGTNDYPEGGAGLTPDALIPLRPLWVRDVAFSDKNLPGTYNTHAPPAGT
jgi:hypothetical protein